VVVDGLLEARAQDRRPVGAEEQHIEPKLGDLRDRGAQVLEMGIAIGTPPTAIEDEHGGLRKLFGLEPKRLAIGFPYRERGGCYSDLEWFDPGGVVGRCAARSRRGCQSQDKECGCEASCEVHNLETGSLAALFQHL
jgi:hypothetical protein